MKKRTLATTSLFAIAALSLTACAGGSGSGDDSGSKGTITIGGVEGWDDVVSSSMLWEAVLEEQGYDVEIEYQDIAVNFVGMAQGDVDLYVGAWLPNTHADYYAQYEDQLENYGAWNTEALNAIAVNEDAPIDSLAELAEHADEFDNQIVGIEAGAGLTQITENDVIPAYGLDGMDFVTSSTPAMLAELQSKIDAGENVAVTLWQPHWAYSALPLKNLEDPDGAFGEPEQITALGREGFAEEHAEVAEWLENFEMDMDTFNSLMDALAGAEDEDQRAEALQTWMEENREFLDGMTA